MKKYIISLFSRRKNEENQEKRSLAEFFLHATPKEKEKVFIKAAQKANEDQKKLLSV